MPDRPAVTLDAVGVTFGSPGRSVTALDAVTATLPIHGIVGLIGRNGAGKTTLLRVLAGREPRHAGVASVFGVPAGRLGSFPGLVHLSSPVWAHAADQSLHSLATGLQRANRRFDRDRAHDLLTTFGIPRAASPRRLSSGQASAAMVALALASRAPLTLLDEPQTGLDAPTRALLTRLIVEEQSETPRTWVISTHLIDETAPLFERVLVLDAGRLVTDEPVDDLLLRYVRIDADAASIESLPHVGGLERLGSRASAIIPAGVVPPALASRTRPVTLQELSGFLPLVPKEQP